jgi:ammonium transporter Rh
MGAASDLITAPVYAVLVGSFTGVISAFSFVYLSPYLEKKISLHDTCGIHNLHAIPSWIGCIVSAIAAAIIDTDLLKKLPEAALGDYLITRSTYTS